MRWTPDFLVAPGSKAPSLPNLYMRFLNRINTLPFLFNNALVTALESSTQSIPRVCPKFSLPSVYTTFVYSRPRVFHRLKL